MKRKGIYKGKDAEGYEIYECPICGKLTYVGNWYEDGVLEDIPGCHHYTGVGSIEDMFEDDKIIELLQSKKYKIFYIEERYSWGARHYSYSEVSNYNNIPSNSIIIRLSYYPYGQGSQWSIRENLILIPKNNESIPSAQMRNVRDDWALLEKRPEADTWETLEVLKEISYEEAVKIYNSYITASEEKISIDVEKVE